MGNTVEMAGGDIYTQVFYLSGEEQGAEQGP